MNTHARINFPNAIYIVVGSTQHIILIILLLSSLLLLLLLCLMLVLLLVSVRTQSILIVFGYILSGSATYVPNAIYQSDTFRLHTFRMQSACSVSQYNIQPICVYIYIYIHMCTYVYIYIYIHIHEEACTNNYILPERDLHRCRVNSTYYIDNIVIVIIIIVITIIIITIIIITIITIISSICPSAIY